MASDELWRLVEARHDDGTPALFRIRDLAPRADQPRIFVVELPYPTTELSRLPDAAAYRRLGMFEEQWVRPAAGALDLSFVAVKTDDGSFFLYLYGDRDPRDLIERLSPFDGALGFFDEEDPGWDEYTALRELLAQASDLEPAPPERATRPPPLADATIDDTPRTTTESASEPPASTEAATNATSCSRPRAPASAKARTATTKPARTRTATTKPARTHTATTKPAKAHTGTAKPAKARTGTTKPAKAHNTTVPATARTTKARATETARTTKARATETARTTKVTATAKVHSTKARATDTARTTKVTATAKARSTKARATETA
ncbi:MAG: DUF695 domain-containing protein, partial [Myxococcales bacterium]|nr:DUF695 domain-containing protein [Myxococcales bacterium]